MVPSKSPLIVVDMQNGFLNPKSDHVVPNVRVLLEWWRQHDWPIYFTKFINAPDSQWEQWLDWHRLQGPPETDITSALSDMTVGATIQDKYCYTSITGQIAVDLEAKKWDAAVLCGVATDGCVMETAVDLFQRKVRPVVAVDACSSHAGNEVHEMGLRLLSRSIGTKQMVTVEDLLASL